MRAAVVATLMLLSMPVFARGRAVHHHRHRRSAVAFRGLRRVPRGRTNRRPTLPQLPEVPHRPTEPLRTPVAQELAWAIDGVNGFAARWWSLGQRTR